MTINLINQLHHCSHVSYFLKQISGFASVPIHTGQ